MALILPEHVKDVNSYYQGENYWYIAVQANPATEYVFEDDIYAGYMGTDGFPHRVKLDLNGAMTMASGTIENCGENTDITITGTVKSRQEQTGTVTFVIGKNAEHVTDNGTTFDTDTKKLTIRVHIEDDYKMTEAHLLATPENGMETNYSVSGIDNNTGNYEKFVNVALELNTTATFNPEVEYIGTTPQPQPQPQEITVTNNIAGTTETHEKTTTYLKITVTGETSGKAYNFINAKATYQSKGFGQQEQEAEIDSSDQRNKKAIFNILLSELDETKPVVLSGKYEKTVTIVTNLTNCHTESPVPFPDQIGQSDELEITIKPDLGYKMQLAQYSFLKSGSESSPTPFDTVNDTGATTRITGLATDVIRITITAKGVESETPTTAKYGSINVYKVTLQNLEDFSKKRFFYTNGSDLQTGAANYERVDLGEFVNRLKRLFVTVGDGLDTFIQCGNYNTDVAVKTPEKDVVTVDLGAATIPAHNEDLTDYESETKVFAPFYGFIDIDSDLAGKTISMQYVINVITGGGCVKLLADDIVFAVESVEPNTDVIYRTLTQAYESQTVGNDNFTDMYLQGLTPYILCKWYNKATDNPRNKTLARDKIRTFEGFNLFSDITPITSDKMTLKEQESILEALQNGVYIEASE